MEHTAKTAYLEGYFGKEAEEVIKKGRIYHEDPHWWLSDYAAPPEDEKYYHDDPELTRAVIKDYLKKYPKAPHGISFTEKKPRRSLLGIPLGSRKEDIPLNKENLERIIELIHGEAGNYHNTSIPNR